jgi:transcriptional regulator with XRE-family HTH domain
MRAISVLRIARDGAMERDSLRTRPSARIVRNGVSEMAKPVNDIEAAAAEIVELRTVSSAPTTEARTLERALGAQIRLLRRRQDLSVSDLATAASISLGMLSKIENGQISPSLTTVQSLAHALSVPISSLFESVEERQDCSFVPAGRGVSIERRGTKAGHHYQLLGHLSRGDVVVEPYLITLNEEATPHTLHHMDQLDAAYQFQPRRRRADPYGAGRDQVPPRQRDVPSATGGHDDVRFGRIAWSGGVHGAAAAISVDHRLSAPPRLSA